MRKEFIPIQEILSEVYRQGGDIVKDVTEEDVIMDTAELIGIIGMPELFVEKTAELKIDKFRTVLPCDLYELNQVKCGDHCGTLNASTDVFDVEHSKTNFPTYRVHNNILVVSFETGDVVISYKAMMLDESGAPMVPDDKTFTRALISYIIYKRVYQDYINGKIPNEHIMDRVETNYEFNIAQASGRLTTPTLDECDNIRRLMNSFIFRSHANKLGYKNIGDVNLK